MNPSVSLGLIKLPHLAALCQQIGLSPITGDDYRAAATSIRAGLEQYGPFPILVSDEAWPGLRAWTEKSARETRVVVLRVANGVATPFSDVAADITLPATVGDIMAAAGLAIAPQAAHYVVDEHGNVTQPGAPAQVAPAAPVQQFESPAPPQVQPEQPAFQPPAAPVTFDAPPAAPVYEQPAAQPVADDPWEAQEQPAFLPPAPQFEAPAPQAPVYTEPTFQAPAPVQQFEAPAQPVADDPWEAQAPVYEQPAAPAQQAPAFPTEDPAQQQPVYEAPAAPTYEAPVQQFQAPAPQAPAYTEPTFQAPAPGEQPAFQAPAAPVEDPWETPAPAQQFEQPVFQAPAAPPVPEYQAPAEQPVFQAPAQQFETPVAPPAPVYEPQVQQPVFEAPAAPPVPEYQAPAPTQPEQPVFEAPAPPAYEPPPAPPAPVYEPPVQQPVFEAPAAPAVPAYDPSAYVPEPPTSTYEGMAAPVASQVVGITPRPRGEGLAEVAVVWAGKGGVGKSTCSFSLAQRAAKAGLRVILIDANFGQGDMRTFLRIGNAGLPSIYQAAISGDLKQALIDPDTLNASRSLKLDPLGFAVVQAPPAHLTDATIVTPEAYMTVVEQARDICDLVVIDTQIVESVDTSGMVDRFMLPLLRAGAWGVGITDLSSPGISNLLTRLKAFSSQGVPRENQMTAMNRIPRAVPFNIEGVASTFNEHSVFLGAIYADDSIPENMNRGRAVSNMPVIAPILDAALNKATGRAEFSPNAAAAAAAQAELTDESAKAGGFLGRFRKGKS